MFLRPRSAAGALLPLLALSIAACSSAAGSDADSQKVVFGTAASDHPEAVLVDVMKGGQPAGSCSGAVIAPFVVLTAAHCVDGADGFKVTAPFAGGQVSDASTSLVYDYKNENGTLNLQQHDVGLIILATPIQIAAYPHLSQAILGDNSKVVSIGRSQDGVVSASTMYIGFPVPVRDGTPSGAPNDYLAPGVIQAGDWGGPVESVDAPGTIAAVVSSSASMQDANKNANGTYDYLARVDQIAPWIAQQISAYPQGAPYTPVAVSFPAPFGGAAQVATSGGQVLATPKVMPITYDADAMRGQIEQFIASVGATPWWTAVTSEYGIGALAPQKPVHVSVAPPAAITDDAIKAYLTSVLDGKHADFGAPDPSTIYTIFYPQTTTVTATFGSTKTSTSCVEFGGYHNELTLPTGMKIVYAVVPRCANLNGLVGIDMVTGAGSHELLEAATDPHPFTSLAYSGTNDIGLGLELVLGGGEVGDMCSSNQGSYYKPDGYAFTVQRGWSNAAAAAGHDPCVPAQAGPYFNGAAQLTDAITVAGDATNPASQVAGIKVPVGTSKTFDVVLYSDAPTDGDIAVAVVDGNSVTGGTPQLTFSLEKASGKNGDRIHVTVNAVAMGAYGVAPFLVETTYKGRTTFSGGLVGQ